METVNKWMRYMDQVSVALAQELERYGAGGLSGTQLLFVVRVCEMPGCPQERLAARMGVDGSTVTRRVRELERLGYVERRRDPSDARRLLVNPTDRAFEVLPAAVELLGDVQAALTRGMSREEIELLDELMERTARNAARMQASRREEE